MGQRRRAATKLAGSPKVSARRPGKVRMIGVDMRERLGFRGDQLARRHRSGVRIWSAVSDAARAKPPFRCTFSIATERRKSPGNRHRARTSDAGRGIARAMLRGALLRPRAAPCPRMVRRGMRREDRRGPARKKAARAAGRRRDGGDARRAAKAAGSGSVGRARDIDQRRKRVAGIGHERGERGRTRCAQQKLGFRHGDRIWRPRCRGFLRSESVMGSTFSVRRRIFPGQAAFEREVDFAGTARG